MMMSKEITDIVNAPRITGMRYEDMTLPELLRFRDRCVLQQSDITVDLGPYSYKLIMSRLQQLIYHHRTQGNRKVYNKEITHN